MITIPAKGSISPKRKYKSGDELLAAYASYIVHCNQAKRFPNIAGFAVHQGINTDTIYKNKEYYPEEYKKVEDMLLDECLNNKTLTPAEKIFYLKNKYGWTDRQELAQTVTDNRPEMTDQDKINRIRELSAKHGLKVL